MKLYIILLVVAVTVAAVNCYQEEEEEHKREAREINQRFNHQQHTNNRGGIGPNVPRWNPNSNGGAFRHRFKRQNSVSVGADHSRGQGSNVNVEAQRRLWTGNNGRSQLDAHGNYNQHFGGPGRSRDYGAGVRFQHRF